MCEDEGRRESVVGRRDREGERRRERGWGDKGEVAVKRHTHTKRNGQKLRG